MFALAEDPGLFRLELLVAEDTLFAEGGKAFYTTPIKALSNQKYADLVRRHGADKVGLLTGDNAVNDGAPVVVMTTEVLRNMIYARSSALRGLRYVVLDEVHYLQDAYRGPVWEEVIIHTPPEVEVRLIDENVERIDFTQAAPDLVGITTMTATAPRAYEIASRYRAQGAKVVLGGVHASMVPDEALRYADAVVVGEGESVWPRVLADFEAGRLEPLYRQEDFIEFTQPLQPRRRRGGSEMGAGAGAG